MTTITAHAPPVIQRASDETVYCEHCREPIPSGSPDQRFCCRGCASAFALVKGLGLEAYYRRRTLDQRQRSLKPDEDPPTIDYASYVVHEGNRASLSLMIEGLHCAACVWLIESVLGRQSGVISARVNMTTRRLRLVWQDGALNPQELCNLVGRLGYRLVPYNPDCLDQATHQRERDLLRCMAVAGFAFGNVMLLSVSIWAGQDGSMGPATRGLLHWLSALIALPAIAFAARPFIRSAVSVLRFGRTNMDVPITIGILLTSGMSLYETIRGGPHTYFDSAIGLLFFLLVGRYLDLRARGRARTAAEHLVTLTARAVTVLGDDGQRHILAPHQVAVGMRVPVAAGERIPVDGVILDGRTSLDTSLIDGESLPKPAEPGGKVLAGTVNVGAAITVEVTATGDGTLLAEITRLVEAAEEQRGQQVSFTDRIARLYAPVVHLAAFLTFVGWSLFSAQPWQEDLLVAVSVLIITCPCALALAIPVVHVLAIGELLRRGVLVKTGTALERMADVGFIAFDKTGTLTEGRPKLLNGRDIKADTFILAASMAAHSRHPLARALVRAAEAAGHPVHYLEGIHEYPGEGLELSTPEGPIRLGSRRFCNVEEHELDGFTELWLACPPFSPIRFAFADQLRVDAKQTIDRLLHLYMPMAIISGDREVAVEALGEELRIDDCRGYVTPSAKVRQLRKLHEHHRDPLMVGDGLNDAPALAAAHISMSPASAADASQMAADIVYQGERLAPVVDTLLLARRARKLVRQNLALAFLYNIITVPLAIAGHVTPLVAAIAMSSSSVLVILNALRLNRAQT